MPSLFALRLIGLSGDNRLHGRFEDEGARQVLAAVWLQTASHSLLACRRVLKMPRLQVVHCHEEDLHLVHHIGDLGHTPPPPRDG